MHPQLELLLQIQDLKSQRRELAEGDAGIETEEFHIDADQAIAQINEKIDEMKAGLEPRIRSRLEKISASGGRAVVPLIKGTCYGCFTNVPTASLSLLSNRNELHVCENCGRFLYSIDN